MKKTGKQNPYCGLSGVQLAQSMGVGRSTLTDWTKRGCPRNQDGSYDICDVVSWRIEQAEALPAGDDSQEHWDMRKARALALKHELALDVEKGKYLLTSEAAAWWHDMVVHVVTGLRSLGAAVAPALVGQPADQIRKILDERLRMLCDAFSRDFLAAMREGEKIEEEAE